MNSKLSFDLPEVNQSVPVSKIEVFSCNDSLKALKRHPGFEQYLIQFIDWTAMLLGINPMLEKVGGSMTVTFRSESTKHKAGLIVEDHKHFELGCYIDLMKDKHDFLVSIAHEMIHVMQVLDGSVRHGKWEGQRITPDVKSEEWWTAAYLHYRSQPHELEAWHNDNLIAGAWIYRCKLLNQQTHQGVFHAHP